MIMVQRRVYVTMMMTFKMVYKRLGMKPACLRVPVPLKTAMNMDYMKSGMKTAKYIKLLYMITEPDTACSSNSMMMMSQV